MYNMGALISPLTSFARYPALERSRVRTSGISVFAVPYGRVSVLARPSCRDAKRYTFNDPEPYHGSSPILIRFNRPRIIRISML